MHIFIDFSVDSLSVVLWAFIVSQAFGVINIGLAVYRYQVKKRRKTLKIKVAGNVSKLLNFAFLLNFSLVGLKIVSIIKNLTLLKISKDGSKVSLKTSIMLLILFCAIKTAVVFTIWWFNRLWFEWVILAAALFAMTGKWQKNIHIMRISSVVYQAAVFINCLIFFLNFTSLIKAVFVFGSISVFYILLLKGRAREKRLAEVGVIEQTKTEAEQTELHETGFEIAEQEYS